MKVNLEKNVMERVIGFEKRRSFSWIVFFLLIAMALGVALVGALLTAVQIVTERQSMELFALLGEDPEIIGEFWRDSLFVFFQELPLTQAMLFVFSLVLLTGFVLRTTKVRNLTMKRIEQLLKYK